MPHRLTRTLWIACLGLMIAALVAGCGDSVKQNTRQNGGLTVTKAPTLTWEKRPLPPNATGWAVSPVDSHAVWTCVPGQTGSFTVMASHDGALTWTKAGSFSLATPEPTTSCSLIPDQDATNALVATITWGSGEAGTLRSVSLYSSDGGSHWYRLPGEMLALHLASMAGKTYAILCDTTVTATAGEGSNEVVVSTDGMHTWRSIRPAGLSPDDSFFSVQLGPTPGELVAASYRNTLWRSTDGGASWNQIATPDEQTELVTWLPQAGAWMFCGWGTSNQVNCSSDMGNTWQHEPQLMTTFSCSSCGKGGTPISETGPCFPSALTADGSLLAFCTDHTAYRLAPHASQWSTLGTPAMPMAMVTGTQIWGFDSTQNALVVATVPA